MSPRMVTLSPSILPFFSRIVNVSSNAWVGCSCAPSPALITLAFRKRDRKWAAPVALWRMMMMSAFNASRLRAVSLSVSPFFSDEASAVKLMTSAVSRSAASSKLIRVRVDGSMNRLTTVFAAQSGHFLDGALADRLEHFRRVEHDGDFLRAQRFNIEQVLA